MLEHVAGLEVLKIEARGFTVASLANGLVSRQDDFHYIVSFITVGSRESVVGSGLESCRNERVPCSSGDSLVDHLALDRADAFDVLGENFACSLHRLGARSERRG